MSIKREEPSWRDCACPRIDVFLKAMNLEENIESEAVALCPRDTVTFKPTNAPPNLLTWYSSLHPFCQRPTEIKLAPIWKRRPYIPPGAHCYRHRFSLSLPPLPLICAGLASSWPPLMTGSIAAAGWRRRGNREGRAMDAARGAATKRAG